MTSVAFQSLGAGFLGYPANAVATSMFLAVENFDKSQPKTSLRLVSCVVFDVDTFKVKLHFILFEQTKYT
jgi:O-acetyl-ADP-ribose deacetylase (regulator of RNase III)